LYISKIIATKINAIAILYLNARPHILDSKTTGFQENWKRSLGKAKMDIG
jgi:hypothetical protein